MPDTTIDATTATLTFGLPQELKTELTAIADKEARPVEALLRELIRDRINLERRREFEAEARRQDKGGFSVDSDPFWPRCRPRARQARHPIPIGIPAWISPAPKSCVSAI